jgi:hypothetical protein
MVYSKAECFSIPRTKGCYASDTKGYIRCTEMMTRNEGEDREDGEHTRVMFQCSLAVCGLDFFCSCGLLDAQDCVWFNRRRLIINKIFEIFVLLTSWHFDGVLVR